MRQRLSVVVIARDEEDRIGPALASVRFADEILVVDTGSRDRTVEVSESFGARVHRVTWTHFTAAKRAGIELARGDWILSLDADERVSPTLEDAIRGVLANGPDGRDGFRILRRSLFLGREMRGGGWSPDRVVRLFCRGRGRAVGGRVHERIQVEGAMGDLPGEIFHDPYRNLEHYVAKVNLYAGLGAMDLADRGRRARAWDFVLRPIFTFFRMLVLLGGVRDGTRGFLLAGLSALAVLVKYAKLWERDHMEPVPKRASRR